MLIQVTNKHNFYDAQLSRDVMQLVNYCMQEQQQHGYRCHPQLEVAFLSFFLIFRRTFVNDQKSFAFIREYEDCKNGPIPLRAEVGPIYGMAKSKAYRDFITKVGFGDISQVMSFIWEKVCRNLRNWTDNEMVVTESLKLLLDISNGYESSLLLLKLESVQFVLQHHTVS